MLFTHLCLNGSYLTLILLSLPPIVQPPPARPRRQPPRPEKQHRYHLIYACRRGRCAHRRFPMNMTASSLFGHVHLCIYFHNEFVSEVLRTSLRAHTPDSRIESCLMSKFCCWNPFQNFLFESSLLLNDRFWRSLIELRLVPIRFVLFHDVGLMPGSLSPEIK